MTVSPAAPLITPISYIRNLRHHVRASWQDKEAIRRFGKEAPLYMQRVYVDPKELKLQIQPNLSRRMSGKVMHDGWAPKTVSIQENEKISYCVRHWRDGMSWEDAGAIDFHLTAIKLHGRMDRCKTVGDVIARLKALDEVWEVVSAEKRLRSAQEISRLAFREQDGVLVHFGANGQPIFGAGGQHRLGMALALELDMIPCQLGVCHISAIPQLKNRTLINATSLVNKPR